MLEDGSVEDARAITMSLSGAVCSVMLYSFARRGGDNRSRSTELHPNGVAARRRVLLCATATGRDATARRRR